MIARAHLKAATRRKSGSLRFTSGFERFVLFSEVVGTIFYCGWQQVPMGELLLVGFLAGSNEEDSGMSLFWWFWEIAFLKGSSRKQFVLRGGPGKGSAPLTKKLL